MDKLQGTWVFDKVAKIEPTGYITTSWDLVFVSNGKAFKTLAMTGDTENIHLTNQTRSLTYIAENTEDSVYVIRPLYADYTAYMTIEIISKYDEVENADTLLQALTARASFTPNTSEDIHIPMTSAKGVILKTAGRQCDKDIAVTPTLEELTVTENGEYTPSKAGYSKVTVNVESSGGDATTADMVAEGGHAVINLPNATKIKQYAFYQDRALVNITMPNVTEIAYNAFYQCSKLAITKLPSGITSIASGAFNGCNKIALTELPSGITSIASDTFRGCWELAITEIPSGVTSIGSYGFMGCNKLTVTELPSGVTSIGDSSFYDCTKLAITEIPSGVMSISGNAFRNCTGLTTLTFKGTPTTINTYTFNGCTNLTTINVPWAEGVVANAPWGATNATINYNYTGG